MNNHITSKKGREHVKKSLKDNGWIVETIGKKDEYFKINKNSKLHKIKVKTLSEKNPVGCGTIYSGKWKQEADFMIVCRFPENKEPELSNDSEWLSNKIYEKFETDLDILEK